MPNSFLLKKFCKLLLILIYLTVSSHQAISMEMVPFSSDEECYSSSSNSSDGDTDYDSSDGDTDYDSDYDFDHVWWPGHGLPPLGQELDFDLPPEPEPSGWFYKACMAGLDAGIETFIQSAPKAATHLWNIGKTAHNTYQETKARDKARLGFRAIKNQDGTCTLEAYSKDSSRKDLKTLAKSKLKFDSSQLLSLDEEEKSGFLDAPGFSAASVTPEDISFTYGEEGQDIQFHLNRKTGDLTLDKVISKDKFVEFSGGNIRQGKKGSPDSNLFTADYLNLTSEGSYKIRANGTFKQLNANATENIVNKAHTEGANGIYFKSQQNIHNEDVLSAPQGPVNLTAGEDIDTRQGKIFAQNAHLKAGKTIYTGCRQRQDRYVASHENKRKGFKNEYYIPDPEGKGNVTAKESLTLEAGERIHNDLGTLKSGGKSTYRAPRVTNQGGKLLSDGDMVMEAPKFENSVLDKIDSTSEKDEVTGEPLHVVHAVQGGTQNDWFHLTNIPVPEVTSLGHLTFLNTDDFLSHGHVHGKESVMFMHRDEKGDLFLKEPTKFVMKAVDEVEHRSFPDENRWRNNDNQLPNKPLYLKNIVPTLTSDKAVIRCGEDLYKKYTEITTEEGRKALAEELVAYEKEVEERKKKGVPPPSVKPLEKNPHESVEIIEGVISAPTILDRASLRRLGVNHQRDLPDAAPQAHLDLLETINRRRTLTSTPSQAEEGPLFSSLFPVQQEKPLPVTFLQGTTPEKAASLRPLFSSEIIEENLLAEVIEKDRVSKMGGCEEETNLESLLKNTQAFYQTLSASHEGPVVLTEELLQKADRPILYYVEREYAGKTGLVPQVYRPLQTINKKALSNKGVVLSDFKGEQYDVDTCKRGLDSTGFRFTATGQRNNLQQIREEVTHRVDKDWWGRRKETKDLKQIALQEGGYEQGAVMGQIDNQDRLGNIDYTGPGTGLNPSQDLPHFSALRGAGSDIYKPLVLEESHLTKKKGWGKGMFNQSASRESSSTPLVRQDVNVGDDTRIYNDTISRSSLNLIQLGKGNWGAKDIIIDGKKKVAHGDSQRFKLGLRTPQGEALKAAAQGKPLGTILEKVGKEDPLAQALQSSQGAASSEEKKLATLALVNAGWDTLRDGARLYQDPTQLPNVMMERLGLANPSLGLTSSHEKENWDFSEDVPSSLYFTEGLMLGADNLSILDGSQVRAQNIDVYIKKKIIIAKGQKTYDSQSKKKSGSASIDSGGHKSIGRGSAKQEEGYTRNFNGGLVAEDTLTMHEKAEELVLEGGDIGGLKKTTLRMEKLTTHANLDTAYDTSKGNSFNASTAGSGGASGYRNRMEEQVLNSPNRILGEEVDATADVSETEGLWIDGSKKRVLKLGQWTDKPVEEFRIEKSKSAGVTINPGSLLSHMAHGGTENRTTRDLWHTTLAPSEDAQDGDVPESVVTDPSQTRERISEKHSKHRFFVVVPNMEKIGQDMKLFQEVIHGLKREAPQEAQPYYDWAEDMGHMMAEEGLTVEEQQELWDRYAPQMGEIIGQGLEEESSWEAAEEDEDWREKEDPTPEKGKEKEDRTLSESTLTALLPGIQKIEISEEWQKRLEEISRSQEDSFLSSLTEKQRDPYRDLRIGEEDSSFGSYFPSYEDFKDVGTREVSWGEKVVHQAAQGFGLLGDTVDRFEAFKKELSEKWEANCNASETNKKACAVLKDMAESAPTSLMLGPSFSKVGPMVQLVNGSLGFTGGLAGDLKAMADAKADETAEEGAHSLSAAYPNLPKEDLEKGTRGVVKTGKFALEVAAWLIPGSKSLKFLKAERTWEKSLKVAAKSQSKARSLIPAPLSKEATHIRERIFANPTKPISIEDAKSLGFRGDKIADRKVKRGIIKLNTELNGKNPGSMMKELRREFSKLKGEADIGPLKDKISGEKTGVIVKYKDGSYLKLRPEGKSGHPKIEIKDLGKGISEKITFVD